MLPLWRDRLHIALSPDRVVLARVSRGLRARVGARQVIPCADGNWESALAEALKKGEWRNVDATVILSNHLVRYQLVPWNAQLTSEEEVAALLRHSFSEVYGAAAADWELRWQNDKPGEPWVASGVDKGLLDKLQAILTSAGIKLHSVQPYLMAAFNRWCGEFKSGSQWFVLGEPSRAMVCLIQDSSWRSIGSYRIEQPWQEALPVILKREIVMAGSNGRPQELLLRAPEGLGKTKGVRRLESRPLAGLPVAEAPDFAMALEGVA